MKKAKKIPIDETAAKKVLKVVDAGLVDGLGSPVPGKMCVEAAVCYAFDEEHNDEPKCVAPPVRSAKITINDTNWSSPKARARGMRRAAIAQLGTAGLANFTYARFDAAMAKAFAPYIKDLQHKRKEPVLTALRKVADAANAAAAAFDKDPEAFKAARIDQIRHLVPNASKAHCTYNERMSPLNWEDVVEEARGDKQLAAIAETLVQVLIRLKAPGAKFLYLTKPKKRAKKRPAKKKPKWRVTMTIRPKAKKRKK